MVIKYMNKIIKMASIIPASYNQQELLHFLQNTKEEQLDNKAL